MTENGNGMDFTKPTGDITQPFDLSSRTVRAHVVGLCETIIEGMVVGADPEFTDEMRADTDKAAACMAALVAAILSGRTKLACREVAMKGLNFVIEADAKWTARTEEAA